MTLTASMLLARLRSAGVALWLEDDDHLSFEGMVSDAEVDLLRARKAEVMDLLRKSSQPPDDPEFSWTPGAALMMVRGQPYLDPRYVAFTFWRFEREPDPEQQAQVRTFALATMRACSLVGGSDEDIRACFSTDDPDGDMAIVFHGASKPVGDGHWHLNAPSGDEQVVREALLAAERGEYQAIADYIEAVKARAERHSAATAPYRRQPALQPFTWTDEVLEDAIAGQRTIYRYGDLAPYRLTRRQRLRFEEAKRLGYLVRRRSEREMENAWRTWCKLRHRPVIDAFTYRRYATVEIDATTVRSGPLPEGQKAAIRAVLLRHGVAGTGVGVGQSSQAVQVPIEVAPAVAAALVPLADLMAADGAEAESLRQFEHYRRQA